MISEFRPPLVVPNDTICPQETYAKITQGNPNWNKLSAPNSILYPWDTSSTYIKHPPFFAGMTPELPVKTPIR